MYNLFHDEIFVFLIIEKMLLIDCLLVDYSISDDLLAVKKTSDAAINQLISDKYPNLYKDEQ